MKLFGGRRHLVKGKTRQGFSKNTRVAGTRSSNARGETIAGDGTVLAKSVPTPAGKNRTDSAYACVGQRPGGVLDTGITGFDSAVNFGTTGIEQENDGYSSAHQEVPQTLSQPSR